MGNEILQPIQQYKSEFKDKHLALTEEYFDNLVKQSGVDADENAKLMSERRKTLNKLQAADSNLRSNKQLRGWLIFFIVVLFLAAIALAVLFAETNLILAISLPIVAVCCAVALILVITKVLNKKIKQGSSVVDQLKKEVETIEGEAWKQMQPLNVKYGWNIPDKLIYQTLPHIQLDKYFDEDKHDYFKHNFGLDASGRDDISVCCARSGNSCGNPFLLIRYFVREIVQHPYRGTLTVTWTERHVDSNGKTYTTTECQTLVATVVKPKPEYFFTTCLYYGNDAAPDLKFLRNPVVPQGASDKKIASIVKSGAKKLEKKSRDAINKGESFNTLANSEFDVLFGAADRDHETQFRMMFTPLAQQNIVALLKNKEPYGDDFTFEKNGRENIIYSSHSADLDIDANPQQFVNFDLAKARENFIQFNVNYFASLYFDFAPLFSIPIYQQERPSKPFGECTKHGNIGDFEMESVVNYFKKELLCPEEAATPQILKALPIQEDEQGTLAVITSYAYKGIDHVEYVPTMARNGRTYMVPVSWVEYIPVQSSAQVRMQAVNLTREQFLTTENQEDDTTILVGGVKANLIKN